MDSPIELGPAWIDSEHERPAATPMADEQYGVYQRLFRRGMSDRGVWEFGHVYFSHYMTQRSGQFHRDLTHAIDEALRPLGRLVGACPREHAKTTWGSLIAPIKSVVKDAKRNVVLIGANSREATAKLRNIVAELENNPLLAADYGDDILPARDAKNQYVSYTDEQVILASGARIGAIGVRGKIRGQIVFGVRPDLAVLDEIEDDASVLSPTVRRRTLQWVIRALLPALDSERGSLLWLGTLLHYDSALANAIKDRRRGWPSFKLPALDADNRPLWPERWDRDKLAAMKRQMGGPAFAAEFLNRPIDEESQIFRDDWFRWYDRDNVVYQSAAWWIPVPEDYEAPPGSAIRCGDLLPCYTVLTVDPAIGLDRQHACTAMVVLAKQARTGLLFVIDVTNARWTFNRQIRGIIELNELWHPARIGVEAVGYQQALAQAVMAQGVPVIGLKTTGAKQARIQASSIHVENRRVYLPRNHRTAQEFVDQAVTYPAGELVDMLDAFAMATELVASVSGVPASHKGRGEPDGQREQSRDVLRGF